ncbi:hypothetical protein RND71_008339 [Anisodus tanguticus]|uniref:Uncharacterized protein n=1 Tax=Anisodus tanguticus TaxID=243964 RepID=A0AAE1VU72_9SOLA|nr:hypothetical protein RND71_008339 [Anisodus tanguticus]
MRGVVLAFPNQDHSHTCSVRDRPPQLCIDRKAGRHNPQPMEWLRPGGPFGYGTGWSDDDNIAYRLDAQCDLGDLEFRINCIGSEFNKKGEMKCPNCRKIENGNWSLFIGPENEEQEEYEEQPSFSTLELLSIRVRLIERYNQAAAMRQAFGPSRMVVANGLPIHGSTRFSTTVMNDNVGNPTLMMPYFHQQQFPWHNSPPHPAAIASMMARRRQAAAAFSSVPVAPIPLSYQPLPPSPQQAHYPLMPSQELSLETDSTTSTSYEEHQVPAYHYHYGFRRN